MFKILFIHDAGTTSQVASFETYQLAEEALKQAYEDTKDEKGERNCSLRALRLYKVRHDPSNARVL